MTYLSEDPTFLAGGLLLLSGAFLIALRVTQQGKYLIHAGVALALALTVMIVERLWVTDKERIEQVVDDLRRAVLRSDVEGVIARLAPDAQYLQAEAVLPAEATRSLIRANLSHSHFDFIRISGLKTTLGTQARRGNAEFRAFAKGTLNTTGGTDFGGTAYTGWSLGFRETEPGVWKVSRITPLAIPEETWTLPGGSGQSDSRRLGFSSRVRTP